MVGSWRKRMVTLCLCGCFVTVVIFQVLPRDQPIKVALKDEFRLASEISSENKIGTLNFPPKKPIKPYHGHDFFKDKPFKFDKRFKNPCWYSGEQLKCLPYFFVLGVRKCATTSLFSNIMRHPDALSWVGKESQFFGYGQMYNQTEHADRISEYVDTFDHGSNMIDGFSKKEKDKTAVIKKIIGDGSTDYIYVNYDWTQFPGNENLREPKYLAIDYIHHFLPDAKIILVFRDPIERLYSEYFFVHGSLFKQNNTNRHSFHLCVKYLVGLYKDCFKYNSIRGCVYNTSIQHMVEPSIILNLGIYYIYMEDIFRVYGRNNVLVLHLEDVQDFFGMQRVFDFLEMGHVGLSALYLNATMFMQETVSGLEKAMDKLPTPVMEKIVSRGRRNTRKTEFKDSGAMLEATRWLLADFYRPFNERMAELMNDRYFLFEPV